jgi:hypothetical protein
MEKILYLNSPKNDFLADSFLIGLKALFPGKVFEWPRNKFIYRKEAGSETGKMHGIGFTLYGLLDPADAREFDPSMPLAEFDMVVFGDIYRQGAIFKKWRPKLSFRKTLILDGEDTPALYPFYYAPWKKPYSFFYPAPHRDFIYMKREIVPARTNYYRFFKLIPRLLAKKLALPENVLPVSFSIPESKIVQNEGPQKIKDFPRHIVDEEISAAVPGSVSSYAFDKEADYYLDLQQSRFGITTKRGGWDCLRHYEIAANGAVPCFRDLENKPGLCAPHDLMDGKNCLSYRNWEELKKRIAGISAMEYQKLREGALRWASEMTCQRLAAKTLEDFQMKIKERNT